MRKDYTRLIHYNHNQQVEKLYDEGAFYGRHDYLFIVIYT